MSEFGHYFLLRVQEESADAVETVVQEVAAVGGLVEQGGALFGHVFQRFEVAFALEFVHLPLALVDGDAIEKERASAMSHILPELTLVDHAIAIVQSASPPAHFIPPLSLILNLILTHTN